MYLLNIKNDIDNMLTSCSLEMYCMYKCICVEGLTFGVIANTWDKYYSNQTPGWAKGPSVKRKRIDKPKVIFEPQIIKL